MTDKPETLNFEQTLGAFQALLQRQIVVFVTHPDNWETEAIAGFSGVLDSADRPPDWFVQQTHATDDDRIYWFWVLPGESAEHGGAWIALNERAFQAAERSLNPHPGFTECILMKTSDVFFRILVFDEELTQ